MRYVILCGVLWAALLLPGLVLGEPAGAAGDGAEGAEGARLGVMDKACAGVESDLGALVQAAVRSAFVRVQVAFELDALPAEQRDHLVDGINSAAAHAAANVLHGQRLRALRDAILTAFGCDLGGGG